MPREIRTVALIALVPLLAFSAFSTRTSGATQTPEVLVSPPATACLAPPITFDALTSLLATPHANPNADDQAATIPEGTPADAATIAGMRATLQELVACFNAGEVLRAYALYTPDYLRRIFSNQDPVSPTAYEERATPHPVDTDEHAVICEIRDARVFADGSAGAYATIEYPLIPVPKTFFFTFVRVDDRWLIDGALGEITFSVP